MTFTPYIAYKVLIEGSSIVPFDGMVRTFDEK
jgi:hypothetical protein